MEAPATRPQLRECPGCGLLQQIPELDSGGSANCARCPTILRRVSPHRLQHVIALVIAALVLLVVMCAFPLMSVETAGIRRVANLFSGPEELVRQSMAPLAIVVLFVTVFAPLIRLVATLYVLIRAHERHPPRHLRRLFAWAEKLRPWSMIEVFVLGVFVAYVKLGDLVTIGLRTGVYALFALTIVLVWLDSALDREAVWERLDREDDPDRLPCHGSAGGVGCETCGLVSAPQDHHAHCPRCGSSLHPRRPYSIQRTWALVIGAAILYIPANYYPVLSIVQLGAGQPSTILGGVEELITARQYPLAALVFFASIAVPVLKLVGLSIMMIATQTGLAGPAARPHPALSHRPFYRPLVDDRHLYGVVAWRPRRLWGGDHDPARYGRRRLLCRRNPDDVRRRDLRPAADVGRRCGSKYKPLRHPRGEGGTHRPAMGG